MLTLGRCYHAKPIHGACKRYTSTGKCVQPFTGTTIVLHNRTLTLRDLLHTRSIPAVKSVWACYIPNNILVIIFPHLIKVFLLSFHP